jgi:hypothetical protein
VSERVSDTCTSQVIAERLSKENEVCKHPDCAHTSPNGSCGIEVEMEIITLRPRLLGRHDRVNYGNLVSEKMSREENTLPPVPTNAKPNTFYEEGLTNQQRGVLLICTICGYVWRSFDAQHSSKLYADCSLCLLAMFTGSPFEQDSGR